MSEDESQTVLIKPGSSVYHLTERENGSIKTYCNHIKATKPGTSDNGHLIATLSEVVGDEFRVCDVCETSSSAADLTTAEERELLRCAAGLKRRGGRAFNKGELRTITTALVDDGEELGQLVSEVCLK